MFLTFSYSSLSLTSICFLRVFFNFASFLLNLFLLFVLSSFYLYVSSISLFLTFICFLICSFLSFVSYFHLLLLCFLSLTFVFFWLIFFFVLYFSLNSEWLFKNLSSLLFKPILITGQYVSPFSQISKGSNLFLILFPGNIDLCQTYLHSHLQ